MQSLVIGICGGTGSGKSTLASNIKESLLGDALLLEMDSYYKSFAELDFSERCKINYDHPNSIDVELLCEHLSILKNGGSVDCPVYDFKQYTRSNEVVKLNSKKVIIIDGILLFACPEVLELTDVKVFVDTEADVRILRRIMRDVKERGRTIDSVVNQYLTTVKPMHERYIEPYKKIADVIIPEGGNNPVAFGIIIDSIKKRLS